MKKFSCCLACLLAIVLPRLFYGQALSPQKRFVVSDTFFGEQMAIKGYDSILVFFNANRGVLEERACARVYRIAAINKYFRLEGTVRDYYTMNDSLSAVLSYQDGQLHGECVYYYPNGKLRLKGAFQKGERMGRWEVYFNNGKKEKTLEYTTAGCRLLDCFKENGDPLVIDGNGDFEGFYLFSGQTSDNPSRIRGTIRNGLIDGEWKAYSPGGAGLLNTKLFNAGEYLTSNSPLESGVFFYDFNPMDNIESIPPADHLDYYGQTIFCSLKGAPVDGGMLHFNQELFTDVQNKLSTILHSDKYIKFNGWIILDIGFNKNARIDKSRVLVADGNKELETEISAMLSNLKVNRNFLGNYMNRFLGAGRFYVALVKGGRIVFPEKILEEKRVF